MLENSDTSNIIKQNKSAVLDWWIEIRTSNPDCLYFFGEFESYVAAAKEQHGFISDLKTEGANIVSLKIKQCQPQQLTICEYQTEIGTISLPSLLAIAFKG